MKTTSTAIAAVLTASLSPVAGLAFAHEAGAREREEESKPHTHPGAFTEDQGQTPPAQARSFLAFEKDGLLVSWSADVLFIEGNGLPAHPMMKGITAWQQQVPLPHDFTGANAFQIPLKPVVLETPGELTLRGPIAIAVNGIPIFHALTQSGKDAYAGGELDEWGGHCGRADDYHYHVAPAHLEAVVGKGNPVAYALDGFPIHVADPETDKPLDECHGYFDDDGQYRYVGNLEPPYVMSFFRGAADLESRPVTRGVRPFLRPLRGASITGFEGSLGEGYKLTFEVGDQTATVEYQIDEPKIAMKFTDPDGSIRTELHERRPAHSRPPGGGGGGDHRKGGKGRKGAKGSERRSP